MSGNANSPPEWDERTLLRYFAENKHREIALGEVQIWLEKLAGTINKPSIRKHAAETAKWLVVTREAETAADLLGITEIQLQSGVKGMAAATAAAISKYLSGNLIEETELASGMRPRGLKTPGSATSLDSQATTIMSSAAETAFVKIAQKATGFEAPELKPEGKKCKVEEFQRFIKKLARYKRDEWQDNGMHEACKKIYDSVGQPAHTTFADVQELVQDRTADYNFVEELKEMVPAQMWKDAKGDTCDSATALLLAMQQNVVNKPWEVLRPIMWATVSTPAVIKVANGLTPIFKTWTEDIEEVRYTDFCDTQMLFEAMMEMFQKFQPMVHMLSASWIQMEQQDNAALDDLIQIAWKKIEVLEARKTAAEQTVPQQTGKGKGKGKGKGTSSKGKGSKFDDDDDEESSMAKRTGRGSRSSFNRKAYICFDFRDKGHCRFGDNCQYSHDIDSKPSGGEVRTVGRNEYSEQDFKITEMDAEERLAAIEAENKKLRMMLQAHAAGEALAEARRVQPRDHALQVKPAVSEKKVAPSYRGMIKNKLKKFWEEGKLGLSKGPRLDTCATIAVVTPKDAKHMDTVELKHKIVLDTIDSTCEATTVATSKDCVVPIERAVVVKNAKVSVMPVHDAVKGGKAYYQDEEGAVLYDKEKNETYECPPDGPGGTQYRLPLKMTKPGRRLEVQAAEHAVWNERMARKKEERMEHQGLVHKPKNPYGCDVCDEAIITNAHKQVEYTKDVRPNEIGVAWDLVETPEDIDGNKIVVNAVTEDGVGVAIATKSKSAASLLTAVKETLDRLMHYYRHSKMITRFHSDQEPGLESVVKDYIAKIPEMKKTTTEGFDHDGNSRIERRNRKLREGQRLALLDATGMRQSYEELAAPAMLHASDCVNFLPESGERSPMQRIGAPQIDVLRETYPFGSKAFYWEAPERRASKTDTNGRRAIYLGRSHTVLGGHVLAPADWDNKRQIWVLGKSVHRKTIKVYPDTMLLKTVPDWVQGTKDANKSGAKAEAFEGIIQNMAMGKAKEENVYELAKIHAKRTEGGKDYYKCSWKGYAKTSTTWEPAENLTEYGSLGAVIEFEAAQAKKHAVRMVVQDEDLTAVHHLIAKHKLAGNLQMHVQEYKKEMAKVKNSKLRRELTESEVKSLQKQKVKIVMMRMNPEWHKPNHDHPEGRSKMRWIVLGHTEPSNWCTRAIDAPTLGSSTFRLMMAVGSDFMQCPLDPKDDEISTGDLEFAYLQAYDYSEEELKEAPKYVGYRPYPGARMKVWQMFGPVYGTGEGAINMYDTFSDFMTGVMDYVRISPKHVEKLLKNDKPLMEFIQAHNDRALYVHKTEPIMVGGFVDDLVVRGARQAHERFWRQVEQQWGIRSWGFVEPGMPRVHLGKRLSVEWIDGVKWYFIDQEEDIRSFVEEQPSKGFRYVDSPMMNKDELYSDMTLLSEEEKVEQQSIVGSLQYFANETRDDIAMAVNRVATQNAAPTVGAQKAARRIVAYLAAHASRRLKAPRVRTTTMHNFVDSDHAGDRKFGDTLSRTGDELLCNGMQYKWRSQKQPKTATSSATAEIVALSECVKDVRLHYWTGEEMGKKISWPAEICVDNTTALAVQTKVSPDSRLKGQFDLRKGWLLELQDKNKFKAVKVHTDYNLADGKTKPHRGSDIARWDTERERLQSKIVEAFRGARSHP